MQRYVDSDYVISRLINSLGTAEGSSLPLRVKQGIRVPLVSNLRVMKKERIERGTQITLSWTGPEPLDQISHHVVYLTEFSAVTQNTIGSFITNRSPINIRILGDEDVPITFTVTTVLNNGQSSQVEDSPSISSRTVASFVEPGDQMQAFLPQPPVTTTVDYVTAGVPPAFTSVTCLSDTGAGRIIGVGFRVVAPTNAKAEYLTVGFTIDGNPETITPVVTSTVWEHSILTLPGEGDMGTAAHWRYYHLSTPYNTAAIIKAYKNATATPGTFSVEVTVYYEKAV